MILLASSFVAGAADKGKMLQQADCDALWMKANPKSAEKISESEAMAYITDVKAANPDGDTTIEKNEFDKACSGGMIKMSAAGGDMTK